MQRKRKKRNQKKIQKSKFASRKKKKSMKKQKVEPSSLVIFPNILTKENIFYFEINSVKSKRKKSKKIKQATSVLKRKKKVFVISQQK